MTVDRIMPTWSHETTQHRCRKGGWQSGRTKDCADCDRKRPAKAKRRLET